MTIRRQRPLGGSVDEAGDVSSVLNARLLEKCLACCRDPGSVDPMTIRWIEGSD